MGALHEAGYQGREHYSVEKKALSKAYFKDFLRNILYIYWWLSFLRLYIAYIRLFFWRN